MPLPTPLPFSRRLLAGASVLLGLLVLADLALFGWVLFRSLSQREIEKLLLDTRQEAEGIARTIAGRAAVEGEDLYTAIASQRETLTYLDSVLARRDFVYTVEIRDRDERLVFRARTEATLHEESPLSAGLGQQELAPVVAERTSERHTTRQVSVPIGDLGFLHIGISQGVLEERIGRLRSELVRQTATAGAVTLAMLGAAYAGIWWLWRRGRRLAERAAEAERLAYLGSLAAGLAHEIRNPLNSLSLNMQLLAEEPATGHGDARRLLDLTREEIGRLDRLVTDFLAYARPRRLEPTVVAPAELLDRARDLVAPQARLAGVEVAVADASGGAAVRVDREQMVQLLLNLLQNALAATEGRGREGRIRLAAERRDGRVELSVADNGAGIPPGERGRIFQLFYSGRRGGTGLGLAIAQRIARAHGAELDVDSLPGQGATFRLRLPAAGSAAAREGAVSD